MRREMERKGRERGKIVSRRVTASREGERDREGEKEVRERPITG